MRSIIPVVCLLGTLVGSVVAIGFYAPDNPARYQEELKRLQKRTSSLRDAWCSICQKICGEPDAAIDTFSQMYATIRIYLDALKQELGLEELPRDPGNCKTICSGGFKGIEALRINDDIDKMNPATVPPKMTPRDYAQAQRAVLAMLKAENSPYQCPDWNGGGGTSPQPNPNGAEGQSNESNWASWDPISKWEIFRRRLALLFLGVPVSSWLQPGRSKMEHHGGVLLRPVHDALVFHHSLVEFPPLFPAEGVYGHEDLQLVEKNLGWSNFGMVQV
ncbi:MAG: hypothetical protein M1823_003397 [Watsoniomyces obsoletus]|nr:MAG: hypothetical protein M1823_003397 [Watsoniomyces obsoletus]